MIELILRIELIQDLDGAVVQGYRVDLFRLRCGCGYGPDPTGSIYELLFGFQRGVQTLASAQKEETYLTDGSVLVGL